MELRCFLAHISSRPNEHHVDFPFPLSAAKAPVLGRHSPELYWHLGNNPRCSRRVMTFAVEASEKETFDSADVHHAAATPIHPQVAYCLVLTCVGENPLTVVRRETVGNCSSLQAVEESRTTVLCRNESTILRVGDKVGIMNRVWMQVVLARICVSETVKGPPVVQEADEGTQCYLPPGESECIVPLPTIYTNVPWKRLRHPVRSRLIWAAARQQQRVVTVRCSPILAALPNTQAPLALNGSLNASMDVLSIEHEGESEAAANACASGTRTSGSGGRVSPRVHPRMECDSASTAVTNTDRKWGTCSTFLGDSLDEKSLLNSLDEVHLKRRRMSLGDGSIMDNRSTTSVPDTNSYMDTLDERLNEELCRLEKRTADAEQLISGRSMAVLGGSPPGHANETMERKVGVSIATTVSRDQLQMSSRLSGRNHGLSGAIVRRPVPADSQVVYYRH
ncbi:hypothetical protein, conserved [Trypanosoma brucei gambiense DAL972]|uniref:Uncharacterized protein n=2 Tax=Trypanosoma brucei TaxID=5691 RepID=C9ZM10_TRYB9|nr:hypothetical protein, conserved [Trypanosoma brucei gambiense DAL972]RHW72713.1 hypothetical protein DPX39_040018200 [Trypanosoma brucei equiperdum]CBH10435.1 hypothetical protein, conserved [Trypanosoma brucei gambiense DAL972]|eukprot:XP_011772725.1 hypothetical protein, conserved [Trypanosoma brucei gambiense DAL972]